MILRRPGLAVGVAILCLAACAAWAQVKPTASQPQSTSQPAGAATKPPPTVAGHPSLESRVSAPGPPTSDLRYPTSVPYSGASRMDEIRSWLAASTGLCVLLAALIVAGALGRHTAAARRLADEERLAAKARDIGARFASAGDRLSGSDPVGRAAAAEDMAALAAANPGLLPQAIRRLGAGVLMEADPDVRQAHVGALKQAAAGAPAEAVAALVGINIHAKQRLVARLARRAAELGARTTAGLSRFDAFWEACAGATGYPACPLRSLMRENGFDGHLLREAHMIEQGSVGSRKSEIGDRGEPVATGEAWWSGAKTADQETPARDSAADFRLPSSDFRGAVDSPLAEISSAAAALRSTAELLAHALSLGTPAERDLRGVWLVDSSIPPGKSDLSGVGLSDAYLQGLDLQRGIARNASFCRARLEYANLTAADLSGADFTGAALDAARFGGAVLTGAKLWGFTAPPLFDREPKPPNFDGANWWEAEVAPPPGHDGERWDDWFQRNFPRPGTGPASPTVADSGKTVVVRMPVAEREKQAGNG